MGNGVFAYTCMCASALRQQPYEALKATANHRHFSSAWTKHTRDPKRDGPC